MYDLIYMSNLKKKQSKHNKMKTVSSIQRAKEGLPEGRGVGKIVEGD